MSFYDQATTLDSMDFDYSCSRDDGVVIISGKHKGETGIVDAYVLQRRTVSPKEHSLCHDVLMDNRLVIIINVN